MAETNWPEVAAMLLRGDPDEMAAHLHKLDPDLYPAPTDTDPVGRPGQVQGDQHWPETDRLSTIIAAGIAQQDRDAGLRAQAEAENL